jgi:hypothetical protein
MSVKCSNGFNVVTMFIRGFIPSSSPITHLGSAPYLCGPCYPPFYMRILNEIEDPAHAGCARNKMAFEPLFVA